MIVDHWKLNQALAGSIITLGGFGFGCGLAWTATALPSLEETGQVGSLSSIQKSWIASFFAVGALLACPATGMYINSIGRRNSLVGFSGIGLLGWLLLGYATDPIYIYCGRLLTGVSTGGYTIVVPIYLSEIASKENRGILGSMFILMLCLGKLFSNGIGISFPAKIASYLCAIHPFAYATALLFIPESPKLLVRQGKMQDAYDALKWLETTGLDAPFACIPKIPSGSPEMWSKMQNIMKLAETQQEPNTEERTSLKEYFTSRELFIPSTIVFIQMLLAQFCGINISTFFTVEIFKYAGDNIIDSNHATLVLAVVQTIGCLPCSIFVDKYGRKGLIVSSFITMSVTMLGVAIFFYIKSNYTSALEDYPLLGLLPVISLIVYNLAYSWGIGSVVWIIMSELLPPKIAGPAAAVANIIYWGGAFCVTQTFQMFNTVVPLYSWFLAFSIACAIGFLFNIIFLPETKGLSTHEIQERYRKEKEIISDVS